MNKSNEKSAKYKRYHVSTPRADTQVINWFECQSNVSLSIRVLIKNYIELNGMTDASCLPVIVTPTLTQTESVLEPNAINSEPMQNSTDMFTEETDDTDDTASIEITGTSNNDIGKRTNSMLDDLMK